MKLIFAVVIKEIQEKKHTQKHASSDCILMPWYNLIVSPLLPIYLRPVSCVFRVLALTFPQIAYVHFAQRRKVQAQLRYSVFCSCSFCYNIWKKKVPGCVAMATPDGALSDYGSVSRSESLHKQCVLCCEVDDAHRLTVSLWAVCRTSGVFFYSAEPRQHTWGLRN